MLGMMVSSPQLKVIIFKPREIIKVRLERATLKVVTRYSLHSMCALTTGSTKETRVDHSQPRSRPSCSTLKDQTTALTKDMVVCLLVRCLFTSGSTKLTSLAPM